MHKGRLEAFSDGVFAILITIMVLEIKVPQGSDLNSLIPVIPIVLSYILSFIYLAIYWNNHHHMLYTVKHITGDIMWANLHLLFWLSLVPFVTGWVGENNFAQIPMLFYGIILFMAGTAYYILQSRIIRNHGRDSILSKAIGIDYKGKISPILYLFAIFSCFLSSWIAGSIYILVALIWLIPDKRIELILKSENNILK